MPGVPPQEPLMTVKRSLAILLAVSILLGPVLAGNATAQAKPEGEMRWALYVTLAPSWFDPAEVVGVLTPFWVMYALHDALVKPMPGTMLANSLAESWTMSPDGKAYEFKLRDGVKFHNGEPLTAEDVKFSFERAKGKVLHEKVKEVAVVDPRRVRCRLNEPWPDCMMFYGTFASGAAWIVPKKYVEQVGPDGFKKNPIGLGPYKFVSNTPGVELVLEAYEGYWRKMPSVKRLVFKSVPGATTRLAMLSGRVDLAYLLSAPMAQDVSDPASSWRPRAASARSTRLLRPVDPSPGPTRESSWRRSRRRQVNEPRASGPRDPPGHGAAQVRVRPAAGPHHHDPAKAKQLLAETGCRRIRRRRPLPVAAALLHGRAVANNLGAVGIKTKLRTMERAAFYSALGSKKLKGLCLCINAVYGNAASRLSEIVPSDGAYAYGGYPDVDALYKQQSKETDKKKREAQLHQIQRIMHERVRYAPIYEYVWLSGVGPRVEDPALMLIDPYPWSAPLEEVRLKKR
jgi:peptide/nickel transport system substrate-binding protein